MGSPLVTGFGVTDLSGTPPAASTAPITVLKPGDTFSQAKATTRLYQITLVDPATVLAETGIFDPSVALRCFAWEGGSGPAIATPAVAWLDASAGTVLLTIAPSDLAGLQCQPYPLRIEVDRGGQWQDGWDGWVDVTPEPSTTATTPVYADYASLIRFGGSAVRQLLADSDEGAGFLVARGLARAFLDQVIIARYRPIGGYGIGSGFGQPGHGYWNSPDTPNPIIVQYLAANFLIATPQVVEAVSRKALAIIYDRQEDERFRVLASVEHRRADLLIVSLVAQIDINGDGYSDISINLGVSSMRNI